MDVECDYNLTKREITIAKHSWKGWCVLRDGKDTITDVPMTRDEAEEFARRYAQWWGDRFAGVALEGMQKKVE